MSTPKKNLNKEIIALFSGQASILTVPKLYVQLTGSYSLGLVLNQAVFWSNKSSLPDGWFHKQYDEWFEEIYIPERTLRRKLDTLSVNGWVTTKVKKVKGINTKHVLVHMEKIIESINNLLNNSNPIQPSDPDGSNNDQNTCTKTVPCSQSIRSEPAKRSVSSIYTEENKQIITPIQTPTGVSKSKPFGLKEMLKDNPFGIPENVLADWLIVRNGKRAKMTETAWNQVTANLKQLQSKGLEPLFCFVTAVSRGWAGIEVRFYNEYLETSSDKKYITKEERAANELKIRERELRAQAEKQKEKEGAKSIGSILEQASRNIDLNALLEQQRIERLQMGMTGTEYHKYVINKTNDQGMPNNPV